MTTPADGAPQADPAAADAQPTDTAPSEPVEPTPETPEPTPNSEAARYRVQLREAQAERDELAGRLTGYQRNECERAVADLLEQPGDLWEIAQADVAAFYGDDGTLNEAELRAAAGALIDQRPRLAKPMGPRLQNAGQYSSPPPQPMDWGSVIKSG
jgi:hypothetical protein